MRSSLKNTSQSLRVQSARKTLHDAINKGEDLLKPREDLKQAYLLEEQQLLEEKISQVQHASHSNQHLEAWKVINDITGRKRWKTVPLRGSIDERNSAWLQHFGTLLGEPPLINNDDFDVSPIVDGELPITADKFTMEELDIALKQTRSGRAVGLYNIPWTSGKPKSSNISFLKCATRHWSCMKYLHTGPGVRLFQSQRKETSPIPQTTEVLASRVLVQRSIIVCYSAVFDPHRSNSEMESKRIQRKPINNIPNSGTAQTLRRYEIEESPTCRNLYRLLKGVWLYSPRADVHDSSSLWHPRQHHQSSDDHVRQLLCYCHVQWWRNRTFQDLSRCLTRRHLGSIPLCHSPRLCHAPSTFFHIWRNRHSPWAQKEQETPRDPSSWSRLCWRHCSSCLDHRESRIPSSQCWVCLKCSWPSSQWRKDKGTSSQHGPNKQHQDNERGYTGEYSSFQVPWIICTRLIPRF